MYRLPTLGSLGRVALCASAMTISLLGASAALALPKQESKPAVETSAPAAAPAAEAAAPAAEGASTVLAGVYTEDQAARGKATYTQNCALCHGNTLRGSNTAPALSGSTFNKHWIGAQVGDIFSYMQANMPPGRGGSLGNTAYADLAAYILQTNKYPSGATELPADPEQLTIAIEALPK